MDTLNFVSVPVIVSAVYVLITLIKRAVGENEKFQKFIPLIAVVIGGILGLCGFFLAQEVMPSNNAFDALILGGSSGLAATGTHQIFKQINKNEEIEPDQSDEEQSGEELKTPDQSNEELIEQNSEELIEQNSEELKEQENGEKTRASKQ